MPTAAAQPAPVPPPGDRRVPQHWLRSYRCVWTSLHRHCHRVRLLLPQGLPHGNHAPSVARRGHLREDNADQHRSDRWVSVIDFDEFRCDYNSKLPPWVDEQTKRCQVDTIVRAVRQAHDLWADMIQISIATWLLSTFIGPAAAAPVVVCILSLGLTIYLSPKARVSQGAWFEKVQKRVGGNSPPLSCYFRPL